MGYVGYAYKGDVKELGKIIEAAKKERNIAVGGNNICRIVTNETGEYAILKTSNIECYNFSNTKEHKPADEILASGDFNIKRVVGLTHKHIQHSAVPILGYFYNPENITKYTNSAYASGYIVQPKAQGEELYKGLANYFTDKQKNIQDIQKFIEKYSDIPSQHFEMFLKNYYEISKDLKIDPSKTSNFFYDENIGFSFIDLNFEATTQMSLKECARCIMIQFRHGVSDEDKKNLSNRDLINYNANRELLYSHLAQGFLDAGLSREDCLILMEGKPLNKEIISRLENEDVKQK